MTFLQFLSQTQAITRPSCHGHQSTEPLVYQLPFEFVIPNSLISAHSDVAPDFLNLLPTVKEGPVFQRHVSRSIYMRPMIMYVLTASAVHMGSGKQSQCSQEIIIMPSTTAAPPLQIEHFPHEYKPTSSKALRRHLWSRPIGRLTISADEPQPFDISTSEPRASTTLSIKLFFKPCKARASAARPYDWKITVKTFLRIKTFFTTRKFTQVPTQKSAGTDSLIQMDSRITSAEARHCNTLPWRLHRLSSIGTIVTDDSAIPWTTTLIVPVNANKVLLPTFLSPLAARRYALVVNLTVGDTSHGTLALEIPIQVICNSSPRYELSSKILCGQESESPLNQDLEGMAFMTLEDGQELDLGDTSDPPPYTKH